MIVRKSIRQMFRTPLRTILFFLLIAVSAAFLVVGVNLWQINVKNLEELENQFTTIGTVEQKAEATSISETWDAGTKEYTYHREGKLGRLLEPEDLNFEGADYVIPPRKRVYFGAYMPDYTLYSTKNWDQDYVYESTNSSIIAEVRPLSTGPANPIKVEVVRLLQGNDQLFLGDLWICDHYNPNPVILEQGKTYIVSLIKGYTSHSTESDEYVFNTLDSDQYTKDGKEVEKSFEPMEIEEVTEGFYETERGKQWLRVLDEHYMNANMIPVQPVDRTDILMDFYTGKAYIEQGRDISEKEYEQGRDVCLIRSEFAKKNELNVGDKITLPLTYATYQSPGLAFSSDGHGYLSHSLINAKGELYQPFDSDEYEIVGIYQEKIKEYRADTIGFNEVIVPWDSVTGNWEDHIVGRTQMRHFNTTFQIENGKIDEFRKAWKKQEIDNLEIKFYDKGYSKMKEGIENRRITAYMFLSGGVSMGLLILVFFCHLFISKQELRTAIERMLGMTKRQCTVSLLSGLLFLAALGAVAGSGAGAVLTRTVLNHSDKGVVYDMTYSAGTKEKEKENVLEEQGLEQTDIAKGAVMVSVLMIVTAGGISAGFMRKNLKKEPLVLMERCED